MDLKALAQDLATAGEVVKKFEVDYTRVMKLKDLVAIAKDALDTLSGYEAKKTGLIKDVEGLEAKVAGLVAECGRVTATRDDAQKRLDAIREAVNTIKV